MSGSNTVTVSTAAQLQAALNSATSGETILLKSGNYGALNILNKNFSGSGVTIEAANASADAVVSHLNIQKSSGITVSGLDVNESGGVSSSVLKSSNITLTNLDVHGKVGGANGMEVNGSSNVTVSNSTFTDLSNGVSEANNNNVVISGNTFTQLLTDAIDNAASTNVTISNNSISDFAHSGSSHPDGIQFWTLGTNTSSSNIVISDNTMSVGSGTQFQGIFMTDQVGNLPYQNVTITGNSMSGTMYNGLVLENANNATVTNNTVLGLTDLGMATTATNNAATSFIEINNDTGVSLSGNNGDTYGLNNDNQLTLGQNSIDGVVQQNVEHSSVSATLSIFQSELIFTGSSSTTGTAKFAGQTIMANNAGDNLYDDGAAGGDTLIGGSGNDYLVARGSGDVLTGGAGKNLFAVGNTSGNVTITDFAASGSHDTLDIRSLTAGGHDAILTDSGQNTIISFAGASETITLLGVHANQLTSTTPGLYNH
jgi:parallel beta-helix repeat protein